MGLGIFSLTSPAEEDGYLYLGDATTVRQRLGINTAAFRSAVVVPGSFLVRCL